jgi:hypothetical protein
MNEIQDLFARFWTDLLERPTGPLALRFYIQPAVATLLAVRDGLRDARSGRSPYFWTVLSDPTQRSARLREGLAATSKVLVLAIVLDLAYQVLVLQAFYPLEALVVAITVAFLPYLLIRGPAQRVATWWKRPRAHSGASD